MVGGKLSQAQRTGSGTRRKEDSQTGMFLMEELWYIHTMELLAIKINELPTHATTWMSPENIGLS